MKIFIFALHSNGDDHVLVLQAANETAATKKAHRWYAEHGHGSDCYKCEYWFKEDLPESKKTLIIGNFTLGRD